MINTEFNVSNIDKIIITPEISTWLKNDEVISELLEDNSIEIDLR